MKLVKFLHNENQDAVQDAIDTVTMHILGYSKMYELLHKQIWRKAPYRIKTVSIDAIPTFNNRPVCFIQEWDIKSPSTSPYVYNGGDHTFGLNQLFVGQDYRKTYSGDPKSGIYHDTCCINPRDISTTASTWGYKTVWILRDYDDNGVNYNYSYVWLGQDDDGNSVIDNVVLSKYSTTINNVTTYYKKIVVYSHDGLTSEYELGSCDIADSSDILCCDTSYPAFGNNFGFSAWYKFGENMSQHGNVISQIKIPKPTWLLNFTYADAGWIRVYEDGTVLEFTPMGTSNDSDACFYPTYRILPMMYTDTGDLTMDKVEFVENWASYFELIVVEDSEWWSGLIKPIAIIVTAVITYFTWGATSGLLAAAVAIGGTLTIIGIISDNQNLMLIGGIMMAGASLYTALGTSLSSATAGANLSTISSAEALVGTSFQSTFGGYASAAGFENLLVMPTVESYTSVALEGITTTIAPYAELGVQAAGMSVADYVSLGSSSIFDNVMSIGKDLYSLYNDISSLSTNSNASSPTTTETKQTKKVYYTMSDERIFDPNKVINGVIDIL